MCFYVALSRGAMGASAALSGLLAAAIPAVVSIVAEGSPGMLRMVGFVVAGAAIWLIAAGPNAEAKPAARSTFWLAVLAGVGFGIYFVALKMAGAAGVIWPMATARMGSLSVCSLMLLAMAQREARSGTDGADDADGCGLGAGGGGAGYVGEPAVYCGYAGGTAGCGGGAGFALSCVDDSAGGLDAAGAAYSTAGSGNGGGCGGGGDDYTCRA